MEKNYYEILEVDKHASSDIIKKAYTTLAKKYHPDLQPDDQKEDAKKKLQKINEAYETLGNIEKKKIYDSLLEDSFVSKKEYDSLYVENQHLKQLLNETKEKYSPINTFNSSLCCSIIFRITIDFPSSSKRSFGIYDNSSNTR